MTVPAVLSDKSRRASFDVQSKKLSARVPSVLLAVEAYVGFVQLPKDEVELVLLLWVVAHGDGIYADDAGEDVAKDITLEGEREGGRERERQRKSVHKTW